MIKDQTKLDAPAHELSATDPWVGALIREQQLPFGYFDYVTDHFARIASTLSQIHAKQSQTLIVGVNGSQGSGKSTMSLFLKEILERYHNLSTVIISIDDLYLSTELRQQRSRDIHPLLQTRGVPGTHDATGGLTLLQNLKKGKPVRMPRFDKATDNPKAQAEWEAVDDAVDLVLFEGWCVGAISENETRLGKAVNELERSEDPSGVWRKYVNQQLAEPYADLFQALDFLIHLKAPSFDCVFNWRSDQERKLKQTADPHAPGLMNEQELERFIMHYERLTRWMLDEMSERADITLELNPDHSFQKLSST